MNFNEHYLFPKPHPHTDSLNLQNFPLQYFGIRNSSTFAVGKTSTLKATGKILQSIPHPLARRAKISTAIIHAHVDVSGKPTNQHPNQYVTEPTLVSKTYRNSEMYKPGNQLNIENHESPFPLPNGMEISASKCFLFFSMNIIEKKPSRRSSLVFFFTPTRRFDVYRVRR